MVVCAESVAESFAGYDDCGDDEAVACEGGEEEFWDACADLVDVV